MKPLNSTQHPNTATRVSPTRIRTLPDTSTQPLHVHAASPQIHKAHAVIYPSRPRSLPHMSTEPPTHIHSVSPSRPRSLLLTYTQSPPHVQAAPSSRSQSLLHAFTQPPFHARAASHYTTQEIIPHSLLLTSTQTPLHVHAPFHTSPRSLPHTLTVSNAPTQEVRMHWREHWTGIVPSNNYAWRIPAKTRNRSKNPLATSRLRDDTCGCWN